MLRKPTRRCRSGQKATGFLRSDRSSLRAIVQRFITVLKKGMASLLIASVGLALSPAVGAHAEVWSHFLSCRMKYSDTRLVNTPIHPVAIRAAESGLRRKVAFDSK